MSEPFTIITTVSPDFRDRFDTVFRPTWENAGAAEIVVHDIDAGSWPGNVRERARHMRGEVLRRVGNGERVLFLDADCIVIRDLSGGFSPDHAISVARWPNPNMGVAFFNLAVDPARFTWPGFIMYVVTDIERKVGRRLERDENPMLECDQPVWRHYLQTVVAKVFRLPEWEYNYSEFDLPVWTRQLPNLRPILKVLHIKGHGDWQFAELDKKVAYAKTLWPEELSCIE
jgi:hypothetical protein